MFIIYMDSYVIKSSYQNIFKINIYYICLSNVNAY